MVVVVGKLGGKNFLNREESNMPLKYDERIVLKEFLRRRSTWHELAY